MCCFNKNLFEKLGNIENKLWVINSIVEVTRDSCENNDYTEQQLVLDIAHEKLINLIDEISIMY